MISVKFLTHNKKNIFIFIVVFLLLFWYVKRSIPPKLQCNDTFLEDIKAKYKVDSVKLVSTIIQEEIYFERIKSITLYIYNPTTPFFDFKKYKGERLENFEEIDEQLNKEGMRIAKKIEYNCSCKRFNNIMIVFLKKDDNRFVFSYSYDNCRDNVP